MRQLAILVVIVSVTLCSVDVARAQYEGDGYRVKPRPGSVEDNTYVTPQDEPAPEPVKASLVEFEGGLVGILSATYYPPVGYCFVPFSTGNFVDIMCNPDGFEVTIQMQGASSIQVSGIYTETTAATFPLRARGNLTSGGSGGSGTGGGEHWAAVASRLILELHGYHDYDGPAIRDFTHPDDDEQVLYCQASGGYFGVSFRLIGTEGELPDTDYHYYIFEDVLDGPIVPFDGIMSGSEWVSIANLSADHVYHVRTVAYAMGAGSENRAAAAEAGVPPVCKIYTDSDNDDTIEECRAPEHDAEEYKKRASGRVLCVNCDGDESAPDDRAEVHLKLTKADGTPLTEGTAKLKCRPGSTKVRILDASNNVIDMEMPDPNPQILLRLDGHSWDLATEQVPDKVYVDGLSANTDITLVLSYSAPGKLPVTDSIALYVTDTISWSPRGNAVTIFEPISGVQGIFNTAGSDAMWDQVKDHGWPLNQRKRLIGAGCTLAELRDVATAGIVTYHAHGHESYMALCYHDSQQAANDWIAANDGAADQAAGRVGVLSAQPEGLAGKWGVYLADTWFEHYWKASLGANKAIVVMMGCFTADAAAGHASVAAASGGRVALGYHGLVNLYNKNADTHPYNMSLFFGRLNGRVGGGTLRTAGKAYTAGNFKNQLKFCGGDVGKWTTLNAAPRRVFPATHNGEAKGAGCIIFDTYMDDAYLANEALEVKQGIGGVSARRWFGNVTGKKYLLSFNYESGLPKEAVRAKAEKCFNLKPPAAVGQVEARRISGDCKTYDTDTVWWPQ